MSASSDEWSLLDAPLFGVEVEDGTRAQVSLAGLLARLSAGKPTELTAVRAYQQHAVHSFLVQLAVLALARAGRSLSPLSEAEWRALLLGAAQADGAGPEAFSLVVRDLAKPAFMQPPIPSGKLDDLKSEHDAPTEELDVLITAKNHDVKVAHVGEPSPEVWAFSLITLQTMQGFLGRGNYGIARMNGGFSSRPCVAFSPHLGAAPRFARDVEVVLEHRSRLLDGRDPAKLKGLLWCLPWDGATSLAFPSLDPSFIEVCRRVRLTLEGGRIVARRGASTAARIEASELHGNTGDPWTPIQIKNGESFTASEAGFPYDRIRGLLFDDWAHGAAGRLRPEDGPQPWLVAQAMVRGQGKTGGYHERLLPVPAKARRYLFDPDARPTLAKRAETWAAWARDARLKVLKPAVLAYLQGGPDKLKFDDDRANAVLSRLDRVIDAHFFRLLFETVDASPEDADRQFQLFVRKAAQDELERALRGLPTAAARRPRAIAFAERAFFGAAKKLFPLAIEPRQGRDGADPTHVDREAP